MLLSAETDCLARSVYYEARNQPTQGQLAVANVVLNRTESEQWPDSVCRVVYQRNQFSWTNDPMPEPHGKAWDKAKLISIIVYILPDPTEGATHFHANYVKPYWAKTRPKKVVIGDHIFYA